MKNYAQRKHKQCACAYRALHHVRMVPHGGLIFIEKVIDD